MRIHGFWFGYGWYFSSLMLTPFLFAAAIPLGFLQVLYGIALETGTPEIFDSRPNVEGEVFNDLYALHTAWVRSVVSRVIDWIMRRHGSTILSGSADSSAVSRQSTCRTRRLRTG